MTRHIRAALALLVAFTVSLTLSTTTHAVENTWDYSVQVSSTVQASPAKITLSWPQDTNGVPANYTVYRRTPGSGNWGAGTTLSGSATSYVDTNVASGNAYEYRIVKVAGSYTGYGYIQTGIEAALVDTRGKLVLVVDNTVAGPLAAELARLEQDLAGDGWVVLRRDVARTDSVASVKAVIKAAYDSDPANVKSVFLFGHVPVPYSGQLNPDGHPDHVGAWPADAYYGDMDGNWTDGSVNYTQTLNSDPADAARMTNKPGDGKFDQTTLPSPVELQVGRVDLANMPGRTTWGGPATFASETELLRKYLNKDHAFRHRKTNAPRRAILGDYFGQRGGEAFAASGFRSFAPLVGAENIRNLNKEYNDQKGLWIREAAANDYLLAYGCGAGSYATIAGLGNTGIYNDGATTEMVSSDVRGVFNLLFGSWLGDWDHEDNILRAPLATSQGLVSVWSGRPHWFIHPMGLGETIGHSARLAMNNAGEYQTQINSSQNRIHIALMGDPTLRLHPVAPVSNLNGSANGSSVALTWSASGDSAIAGYHVYRAASARGPFARLTSAPVTSTSFTDSNGSADATYMVRAIKLESTTSGSYYNASQGNFWSAATGSSGGTTVADTSTPPPSTVITVPTVDTTVSTGGTTSGSSTPTGSSTSTGTSPNAAAQTVVWFDDALPVGATGTSNGDTWNWVSAGPAPFSGATAHKSDAKSGLHEHAFNWAAPISLTAGEVFFTHVYLDPANPPSEIMLSFASSNWEHRAYWGSNDIGYGTDKTASRYYMGPLPAAGQWVRLEVPASVVGLEGASVQGMAFSLFNGSATWDYTGKSLPATSTDTSAATGPATVAVKATDSSALIGSTSDTALVTFTRTGSTAADLLVKFNLSGTAIKWIDYRREQGDMPVEITIPAGSASASMTILAYANATNSAAPTAIFTLAADAAYTIGAESAATVNLTTTATPAPAPTEPVATTPPTTEPAPTAPTTSPAPVATADTVWFDDALPAGAGGGATGGDAWTWVTSSPAPFSGSVSHQSNIKKGLHEHYFNWASETLPIAAGDKLYVYVYLDPANTPSEVMVSWCSNNWEHRAYWGADKINNGKNGTASRHYAGALPAAGQWVRLEVPASAVGLEGQSVQGMSFSLYDGRAAWDQAGKSNASTSSDSGSVTSPTSPVATVTESVWVDDAVPAGAGTGTTGGDAWNWVTSNPAPVAGSKAHQSSVGSGLREHWFNWAAPMTVATGDVIFTYVYLDPANVPSEIMLSFVSDNWEHRAYWGADKINSGTNGTASRRHVGPLPAAGQWVRLEVPASAIGLEGHSVAGMSFGTYDGRATFDKTGKANGSSGSTGGTTTPPPSGTGANVVTIAATDATAVLGSTSDTAVVTFSRSGSTTSALTVKFELGGNAIKWLDYRRPEGDMPVEIVIPAGASSATMTILGIANSTNANPETVTFTLSSDAAYTIGTANTAALTIASSSSPTDGGSSGGTTPPPPTTTPIDPIVTLPPTPTVPSDAVAENAVTRLPEVGDHQLRVLSPTMLELNRITTKQPDPAQPTDWNFVSTSGTFNAPAASEFAVTVNGQAVSVKSIGFRRRVGYAGLNQRDLRIDNALFLELSASVPEGAVVEVKNPSGALWPATFSYKSAASATRFNPAIHVNQEGYVPSFSKKAIVGYYLGTMGELDVSASAGFKLVDAVTGATVHTGTLTARKETGFNYSPAPYQKVLEADFTSFTTPGEYQLVVPGYGASLPFLVNEGIAMNFTRTYAQGLYHQRCGAECKLPFTRHEHGTCHTAKAEIPSPQSSYNFTYTTIASRNGDAKNEPRHTAPRIVDEASLLYPFVNKGSIDVALGHHDAGDYSKYMTNSAALAHLLMFTAENINGAGALDNLGLPESGDGLSDLMQEAKHEADYIAKMQDADGGFYFLVYPKNRSYESDVTPDKSPDTQVVWPKNTAGSAAATAALAQLGSSPKFKAAYPAEAAAYVEKAKKGWTFLMNAIAKYGKDGSYQKLTHYGHNFLHDDEIAWAAAELFLATGDEQYHAKLKEWFPNPSDPATFRWGWWRMCESYGNAIRSYAFAARSGRIDAGKLDAAYLAKCEEQIKLAGDDATKWTNQSAYGTSFPEATKHVQAAGWFFSLDQAADIAVAFQLNPKPEYTAALVGNMNYEAGTNPVNVPYVTGIGLKRQREIVHQWANTDFRSLPMNGIPQGNVQSGYDMLWHYSASGNELTKLSFPSDATGGATYPFYDRWADTWNVSTEFVVVNQARGLMAVTALATQTAAKSAAWKPTSTATINVPSGIAAVGVPVTLTLTTSLDLAGARILWEARDQQADFGSTYTISPKNSGAQWVEAEITWPDGRRAYATGSFTANAALVNWVDEALPLGATAMGSEAWNWVSNPGAKLGSLAHQSTLAAGLHEHAFQYASVPLDVMAGDTMFVWVYLDPANMPEELMVSWNDGSWEHRAFWGADKIGYGTPGTAGRHRAGDLPAGGQWVKLEVPAKAVGLEGSKVHGMSFSAFGGRVTWDATGKSSPVN